MHYASARLSSLAYRVSKKPIASLVLAAAAAAALLPEQLRQPAGLFLTSIMLVALLLRFKALRPHLLSTLRHLREFAGKAAVDTFRRLRRDIPLALRTKIEKWAGPCLGFGLLLLLVWPGLVVPLAAVVGAMLFLSICFGRFDGPAALSIGCLAACSLMSCVAHSLVLARLSLCFLAVGLLLGLTEGILSRSALLAGGRYRSLP